MNRIAFSKPVFLTWAQSRCIRISFAGFDCISETWDDILHSDGKGDDVYFHFYPAIKMEIQNSIMKNELGFMVMGNYITLQLTNIILIRMELQKQSKPYRPALRLTGCTSHTSEAIVKIRNIFSAI